MLTSLVLALTLTAPSGDSLTVPTGTLVPVRFLTPVSSGAARRGWAVEVQAMADIVAGRCVAIPAYTRILGLADESVAGGFFHRRGRLHLAFEAVRTATGGWEPLSAVVEELEWLPGDLVDSGGVILPAQHSLGHRLLGGSARTGVAGAALAPIMGALASPFGLAMTAAGFVERGPRVEVRAGDDRRGPVSPQWLFNRIEDLAFERQGPTARERHHVRFWAADSAETVWVGAANEDVGVYLTVMKPRVTHRIASLVDAERDLLARELEAGGCAVREGLARIPGCPFAGRNSSGEPFLTDGKAVVVRVGSCESQASALASSASIPHPGSAAPLP